MSEPSASICGEVVAQLGSSGAQSGDARTWKTFCWSVLTVIFIVMVVVSRKRRRQSGRRTERIAQAPKGYASSRACWIGVMAARSGSRALACRCRFCKARRQCMPLPSTPSTSHPGSRRQRGSAAHTPAYTLR